MRELGQPLPGKRTLQHHLESYKFWTRMLVNVVDSLAVKIGLMEPQERHATWMLDEIQLTPGLVFDNSSGTLLGAPVLPLADETLPSSLLATHNLSLLWEA